MSDTVFSGLPRFDEKGALRPPTDWLRPLDEAGDSRAAQAANLARAEAAKMETPVVEATPAQVGLRKLEASLSALNGKLDKIERDAKAQTVEAVQSIAAKLFPLLSKDFLAEEIGRHLPELVPASAAVVEIRADASLTDDLQAMVERHAALANRCTIMPAPAPGQGRVDVSWQTGGLSFDFDGLLNACLSHLKPTPTVTKE